MLENLLFFLYFYFSLSLICFCHQFVILFFIYICHKSVSFYFFFAVLICTCYSAVLSIDTNKKLLCHYLMFSVFNMSDLLSFFLLLRFVNAVHLSLSAVVCLYFLCHFLHILIVVMVLCTLSLIYHSFFPLYYFLYMCSMYCLYGCIKYIMILRL